MKSKRRKIPVHEHRGFSIREVRPDYFMVDFMRDGKRERVCFKELIEAQRHCEKLADKIKTEGTNTLILTPAQREDATKALRAAKGKTTLLTAVEYWMKQNGGEEGVTVTELGRRWIENLKAQECRPTTIREREYKVESLSKAMGSKTVASVTKADLQAWMRGKTGATLQTYRLTALAMFGYAVEEGIIEYSVATKIKPVRLDESLPTPMSVEAVRSIMQTAEQWAPAMVPVLAVQFFGGIRPGEAMGLDWSAIDIRQKIIRVAPEVSKVRRSRLVDMNKTLIDWLLPYRKVAGPIGITSPAQFSYFMHRKPIGPDYEQKGVPIEKRQPDKRPKGLIAAAQVKWIQDGPRKTFATMHFATYGDAGKLAGVLGHTSGVSVLYRHYRGLATKADARRYWKIRPKQEGKIIQFTAAAS